MNKITRDYTEHDALYYKASEVDVAIEAQEAEIGRLRAAIAQPATVQPAVSDAEVYAACRELFGGIYSGGMDDMRRALEAFAASRALPVVSPEPNPSAVVGMRDGIYKDSTPRLHVGNSSFEDWFQNQPFATQSGVKQISRDSYAAGMGDPLVTYASTQGAPAQAVKLLRHKFWGAGESDCPKDIKASNGELHTMRCKVCGDNWRKSVDVCFGASPPTEGSQI